MSVERVLYFGNLFSLLFIFECQDLRRPNTVLNGIGLLLKVIPLSLSVLIRLLYITTNYISLEVRSNASQRVYFCLLEVGWNGNRILSDLYILDCGMCFVS